MLIQEKGSTKPDINGHGIREGQILIMQIKYYGVENMKKKTTKKMSMRNKFTRQKLTSSGDYVIKNSQGKTVGRIYKFKSQWLVERQNTKTPNQFNRVPTLKSGMKFFEKNYKK